MSQTALLWLLKDGAYALRNVEIGLTGRLVVVPDVIGKAIGKGPLAYAAVERQRLRLNRHEAEEAHKE